MVTATSFAALAAFGSVWAAFRQEDATYASQLASKQVDLLGDFIGHYWTEHDDAIKLHTAIDDYIRNGKATGNLTQKIDALLDRREALQRALGRMPLAVPTAAADRVGQAALLVGQALETDKERLQSWNDIGKSLLEKNAYDTQAAQKFEDLITASKASIDILTKCSTSLLSGRPLEQSNFRKCSSANAAATLPTRP